MKEVDVLIVNYRTKELTVKAVESVIGQPETNQVIVVDNASGDGNVDYLKERFHSWSNVLLLENSENVGFGAANNQAAEKATSEYLFLLNSDAEAQPGCLKLLVNRLAADQTVGLIAPAVYLPGAAQLQADAAGTFPTLVGLILRRTKHPVTSLETDWVSGVAFLARREEYLRLGGFDKRLFMYFEDIELCYRYRQAGYRIVRELDAGVIHQGGASRTSTLRQKKAYFRSQDQYFRLINAPWLTRVALRISRAPYYLVGRWFLWKDKK